MAGRVWREKQERELSWFRLQNATHDIPASIRTTEYLSGVRIAGYARVPLNFFLMLVDLSGLLRYSSFLPVHSGVLPDSNPFLRVTGPRGGGGDAVRHLPFFSVACPPQDIHQRWNVRIRQIFRILLNISLRTFQWSTVGKNRI